MRSKGETWSRGTNSRLLFDVNMMLNLSNTKCTSLFAINGTRDTS